MNLDQLSIELIDLGQRKDPELTGLLDLINSVYSIAEREFWREGYLRTSIDDLKKMVVDGQILGAKWKGITVACVRVSTIGDRVAKFGMLSVYPNYEGKGIGGRLVAAAEAYASSLGCEKMRLELLLPVDGTHAGKKLLEDWYKRLGYKFLTRLAFEKVVPGEAEQLRMKCYFNLYDKTI